MVERLERFERCGNAGLKMVGDRLAPPELALGYSADSVGGLNVR
jgi:hypothetical protein